MDEKMMTASSSPETSTNEATTSSTVPSWKLYENPFYNSQPQHQNHPGKQPQCHISTTKNQHCLHLPISARKLAASFWDLTFFKPVMETEVEYTRAQIMELKSELEHERKMRKKLEVINKKLAKELSEERRAREAIESVCEELAREISTRNSEINSMRKEMEEERKMLRVAEVIREERVQMKLSEAKFLFEEKVFQLSCKPIQTEKTTPACVDNDDPICSDVVRTNSKSGACRENSGGFSTMAIQKRASPESENPHIKRGIKGFVEFPRVVRAIGSKSRHWGTKLECQKAQLRILLKQRSPIRSNSLIIS
ncbi:protein BRANCHLESS TRICHOME [Argentina anserina]|uniref:protein BRANCHLESS TRICHOME n=1 Tax=Argentina anserina TaxID=57926 RepID=UPI00217692BF|nr:protein BRANCHLESS TRICHOME [Potentilla anserina]